MGAGCCPPWSYNRQKRNWITGTAYSYRRTNTYDMTHRKRQNWSVPHPNRLNRFPSEQRTRHIPTDRTVSHLNRELGVVTSKKTKLIRSTSQQTELFPIWTENSTLLHRKRQNSSVPHPNRLNRFPSEQRTRRCYIEKDKTDPFPIATTRV